MTSAKMIADLYGFVHISSTQGLQGDSEGFPGGIQVVLHHLIATSKESCMCKSADPDIIVIKNIRKHTHTRNFDF